VLLCFVTFQVPLGTKRKSSPSVLAKLADTFRLLTLLRHCPWHQGKPLVMTHEVLSPLELANVKIEAQKRTTMSKTTSMNKTRVACHLLLLGLLVVVIAGGGGGGSGTTLPTATPIPTSSVDTFTGRYTGTGISDTGGTSGPTRTQYLAVVNDSGSVLLTDITNDQVFSGTVNASGVFTTSGPSASDGTQSFTLQFTNSGATGRSTTPNGALNRTITLTKDAPGVTTNNNPTAAQLVGSYRTISIREVGTTTRVTCPGTTASGTSCTANDTWRFNADGTVVRSGSIIMPYTVNRGILSIRNDESQRTNEFDVSIVKNATSTKVLLTRYVVGAGGVDSFIIQKIG
jgi:hypothetical protein